jgi:branched-chain amino acid transport system ATP-binding protein
VTAPLLEVDELSVAYGDARAVFGVSLEVGAGKALAVLGANGAGKSSIARAICGLTKPSGGSIRFDGVEITNAGPPRISRLGLAYLPEGRGIFPGLSVHDNLRMMLRAAGGAGLQEAIGRAYDLFPALAARRRLTAGTLSGGEQQMLALARVLVVTPRMVVADEPSLGLAPKPIEMVFESLAAAREAGAAILLIEQYVRRALAFADEAVILRRGKIAWRGAAGDVGDEVLTSYLGRDEL